MFITMFFATLFFDALKFMRYASNFILVYSTSATDCTPRR